MVKEGIALLQKAAFQGHVYAMFVLGDIHDTRKEYERAAEWLTKSADAGLPQAMFSLGTMLDEGVGVAAPDYPAAVDWYRRAADAGHGDAMNNLVSVHGRPRRPAQQGRAVHKPDAP